VLRGMEAVAALSAEPLIRSSLYTTEPVDCPPGSANFVNAVAILKTKQDETPETLLNALQQIEREFGRQPKTVINEARPLDLDLIAFAGERRDTAELTLPHPRAYGRRFVIEPLAEIAPNLILPGQTRTVADLLQSLVN
jgi:2-amino-4-hydroxy-6-hydroxymethyldihydropteridine diphosphokinase